VLDIKNGEREKGMEDGVAKVQELEREHSSDNISVVHMLSLAGLDVMESRVLDHHRPSRFLHLLNNKQLD